MYFYKVSQLKLIRCFFSFSSNFTFSVWFYVFIVVFENIIPQVNIWRRIMKLSYEMISQ